MSPKSNGAVAGPREELPLRDAVDGRGDRSSTPANPLVELLGAAFAYALRQPEVIAAVREALAPRSGPESVTTKTSGLTKRELAVAIGKSTSSIDRFDREGGPHWYAGDQRRYDLAAYRAWLAARPRKPRKALVQEGGQ